MAKAPPRRTLRPAATSGDGYMTVAEVAVRLRVSKRTVQNFCHRGDLDWIRVGRQIRIDAQSVADYETAGKLLTTNAAKAGAYLQGRA